MDDDGSKSLDFHEFKKGIHDYGVDLEIDVSMFSLACHTPQSQGKRGLVTMCTMRVVLVIKTGCIQSDWRY